MYMSENQTLGRGKRKEEREMRGREIQIPMEGSNKIQSETPAKGEKPLKPPFRPAKDDTKPHLQDPILRSDPNETEEAVLRLPPFPCTLRLR
ncbi:hypothetical protein GQ457_15G029090 [Hibiscus cannabinus]